MLAALPGSLSSHHRRRTRNLDPRTSRDLDPSTGCWRLREIKIRRAHHVTAVDGGRFGGRLFVSLGIVTDSHIAFRLLSVSLDYLRGFFFSSFFFSLFLCLLSCLPSNPELSRIPRRLVKHKPGPGAWRLLEPWVVLPHCMTHFFLSFFFQ